MMDRIKNMLGIARVTMVDDSGPAQELQVDEGPDGGGGRRILNKVRRFAEFGFVSVPPLSAEVLLARMSGLRQQSLVVGSNHQASRPRGLKPGDAGIYDVRGAKIMLTADGLLIDCAGLPAVIRNASKLTIDVPEVEMTGSLRVAGEITAMTGGASVGLGAMRDAYDAHKHTGVASGGGLTGPTDHAA